MKTRHCFLTLIACLLLAMAGCSASRDAAKPPSPAQVSSEQPGPDQQKSRAELAASPAAPGSALSDQALSLPQTRMVIKTASLSLRVRDVDSAFNRAIQLTEGKGGYVQSSTRSAEGGDSAQLTLRVPPDGFLTLINALDHLGTEESKSIGGQDVTEEYYDLDAELTNKQEVRSRLFQLLDRAVKVSDAIQVEEQLERVGGDINRIKGRMKYLTTMVGLSTIDLSIHSEARPRAQEFINWGMIGSGFETAARILVRVVFFILQALVVLIPLAAIGGGVTWAVIAIVRKRKRSS